MRRWGRTGVPTSAPFDHVRSEGDLDLAEPLLERVADRVDHLYETCVDVQYVDDDNAQEAQDDTAVRLERERPGGDEQESRAPAGLDAEGFPPSSRCADAVDALLHQLDNVVKQSPHAETDNQQDREGDLAFCLDPEEERHERRHQGHDNLCGCHDFTSVVGVHVYNITI